MKRNIHYKKTLCYFKGELISMLILPFIFMLTQIISIVTNPAAKGASSLIGCLLALFVLSLPFIFDLFLDKPRFWFYSDEEDEEDDQTKHISL